MSITVRAAAKINLHLGVGRVRQIAHAADPEPVLDEEDESEHHGRQQRHRVQHESRPHRAIVRHPVKRREPDLYGRLEASGTHDSLMSEGGRYAELFELQAAGYR